MKVDRKEYRDFVSKNNRANKIDVAALNKLFQSAVEFKKLTSHPTWNIFCQILQSWINITSQQLKGFQQSMLSPELVDTNEISKIRHYILLCDERINTLESVIELPTDIIENGDQVKCELERIGKDRLSE